MSLCVVVGIDEDALDEEGAPWYRDQIAQISAVIEASGFGPVPTFAEDEAHDSGDLTYEALHQLRVAYRKAINLVAPGAPEGHLENHSDAEGFYLPVNFPTPIDVGNQLGGMVGSAQQLLAELDSVSEALLSKPGKVVDAYWYLRLAAEDSVNRCQPMIFI